MNLIDRIILANNLTDDTYVLGFSSIEYVMDGHSMETLYAVRVSDRTVYQSPVQRVTSEFGSQRTWVKVKELPEYSEFIGHYPNK